jgi:hypothetical protein
LVVSGLLYGGIDNDKAWGFLDGSEPRFSYAIDLKSRIVRLDVLGPKNWWSSRTTL